MKTIKFYLVVVLLIFISANTYAQDKYKNQALFVYNFSRMNAWPQEAQSGEFIIGVFGNSPIYKELVDILNRQAGSRPFVVKQFSNVEDITKCQMIYVTSNQSKQIAAINQKLKQDRIAALVISESRNSIAEGAAVNFVIENDKQRYEISETNARSMGITLGSDMIRLALSAK
jgi:hypothetical protein